MGTNTLNSYTTNGVILTATGADNSPFTVATAGTINASSNIGVYSTLASPFLLNQGTISDTVASEAIGVNLTAGGTIVNSAHALIHGRTDGVVINGATGTVTNAGTISATNVTGVLLTAGGTVTNTGTIAGSVAVHIEGAGNSRVVAGNGAVFTGDVEVSGTNNTLEFAGSGGTVASIGSQFTGFQTVAFDPGAAWSISGDAAQLTGLTAITGFGPGDEVDLTGFAATASSYTAGVGLVLSNATASETIHFTSSGGGVLTIGTDGAGGTDITSPTHTLSTYESGGINVSNTGPYLSPFTVTPTGSIGGGSDGVYSNLSGLYLLNQGSISSSFFGVYARGSATIVNSGSIKGRADGIRLGDGGTVTNSGVINGGALGVLAFANLTLNELAGGVFDGGAEDFSGAGVVNLAGTAAGSLAMGGFFSGFSNFNFGPAAWTLQGTAGELAEGETITGFTVGDQLEIVNFAATSASYVAGAGLVLSNGGGSDTVHFTGGDGLYSIAAYGSDGTDILFGAHTLSTTDNTGITLTAGGPYLSPFTVTPTGQIASSGTGIYTALSGAYLLNQGTIAGAVDAVDAVSGGFTLNVRAGAVFDGAVVDHAGDGVLGLGGSAAGSLGLGGSFSGFSKIKFGAAAWTLSGASSELAGGQTITGFTLGDVIDLTDFAATSGTYMSGAGLVLSNATASETIGFSGGGGKLGFTGDGAGGTDILVGTNTLSTYTGTGITLTNIGPDLTPFTVTPTGRIVALGYGVYSLADQPYLLNQGRITSTDLNSVLFDFGGTVVNAGTIINAGPANTGSPSENSGVAIENVVGTVVNTGTIIGNATDGVYLQALAGAGAVSNLGRSALIYGYNYGVGGYVGTVINTGTIEGHLKFGVAMTAEFGVVSNAATYALISGGAAGVGLEAADATLTNSGTVTGEAYGVEAAGIGDVIANTGPHALIESSFLPAVFVTAEDVTLINAGSIASGAAVAVQDSGFTLDELAGGVFAGGVGDASGDGVLNLAGATAGALKMGGSFSGFSSINFGPAAWTLSGTSSELADGQTITGFTLGDKIDLTDFAATSASYIAGTGLVLSNATASETLGFTGGPGVYGIGTDGAGGTDILSATHTLSTTTNTGITLTNTGPDLTPFTVTSTGTIVDGGSGVFSNLSTAYLLNQGRIAAGTYGVEGVNTVVNTGTISAGDRPNVTGIGDAEYVANSGRSALIMSGIDGISDVALGVPLTVTNTGTIEGLSNVGIQLGGNGKSIVDNAASYAVIYGGFDGVFSEPKHGTASIANAGTIIGHSTDGVFLDSGGAITNSGTIIGGVDAVYTSGGDFNLNELAGGVFEGAVLDHTGSGALNLAGTTAGALAMGGSFSGFTAINFGPAAWSLSGTSSELAGGQAITGFVAGDKLDITDLTFAAPETLTLGASDVLTITQGAATLDVTFSSADTGAHFTVSSDGSGGSLITDDVPCFAAGTRIRTARGDVAVEDLAVGDEIITSAGRQPIKWIGQRHLDLSRHLHPEKARPIRFAAGCLAANIPARDLFLSPDHALYIDDILVPAKALLNGASIRQIAAPRVTYYHIELADHSVIFAENTPAETYLETGNRGAFENGAGAMTLHPDFAQTEREAKSCAPFLQAGPQVEAIRAKILARANMATTDDPAIGIAYHKGAAIISSRYAVPGLTTPDPRDRRRLGVKIARLEAGGRDIPLDHPALVQGWHAPESDGRWTDGYAIIPSELLAGRHDVKVIVAATLNYRIAA